MDTENIPSIGNTQPRNESSSTAKKPTSIESFSSRKKAQEAKIVLKNDRAQKVATLKENWKREKEAKLALYNKKKEGARAKLNQDAIIAEERRQKSLQRQKEYDELQKKRQKEMLAASLEERAQLAADLQREKKARRRISVFMSKQMLSSAQMNEEKMKKEKKQQEIELLTSKQIDSLDIRQAKKLEEGRKRESLVFRGKHFQQQKIIQHQLAQKAHDERQDQIEVRLQNWIDDKNSKNMEERAKRDSMAGRLDEWRMQKSAEKNKSPETDMLDVLTRSQDWKDVKSAKELDAMVERTTIANRVQKWKEEKQLDALKQLEEAKAREGEFDRQRQDIADVRAYAETMQQQKRLSMAYRLDKAAKDANYDKAQRDIAGQEEADRILLQQQHREDVKRIAEEEALARRNSLEYRNQTHHQNKMQLQVKHQAEKFAKEEERKFAELAREDVKKMKDKQQEEEREEIRLRAAAKMQQKKVHAENHRQRLDLLHREMESRRVNYLQHKLLQHEQKERSRKSISMRLDSWTQQKVAPKKAEKSLR